MYSNCLQDARFMRQKFIIDMLTSKLNAYKTLLGADVKNYLYRIVGRDIK